MAQVKAADAAFSSNMRGAFERLDNETYLSALRWTSRSLADLNAKLRGESGCRQTDPSCALEYTDYIPRQAWGRAAHGALPHRAPSASCTADPAHHVWHRRGRLAARRAGRERGAV